MIAKFTPGPWRWWTSNSWRRRKRDDHGVTQNVIEPFVARDGHPDLMVSEADMALIAAAPEMYEILDIIVHRVSSTAELDAALLKAEGILEAIK